MTPYLNGDGIYLWPKYGEPDGHIIHALNQPDLMRYSEQRHEGHTYDTQRDYIKSFDHKTNHLWKVEGQNGVCGTVTAYRNWPNRVANVGILIARPREGYGAKAWKMACDWLLGAGEMRKVEAGCMADNEGMLRIFAKTGMHIEGVRTKHFILEGREVDMILAARFK